MSANTKSSAKPKIACEISADRVLAGRIADNGGVVELCSVRELPPGSVVPDLTEPNILQPEVVRKAVNDALGGVAGRVRDLIGVLPDAAVRVVRFRLKKSLPFDVEKAKVSYHVQTSLGGLRLVAAVALTNVIEDYESAFRDAGYSAGVILPSMLAALGAAEGDAPTLVLKVDARTTSLAILDKQQLLLFRTLENTRGVTITGEQLAEEVYPSVVFFQDTYHTNIERIYVAGLPESGGAAPALRAQTGADVRDLVANSQLGENGGASVPRWRMAGVVGALVS